MHLEKNVFKSTFGVLLDIKTKMKVPVSSDDKGSSLLDRSPSDRSPSYEEEVLTPRPQKNVIRRKKMIRPIVQ
jgi:hypothetical protein